MVRIPLAPDMVSVSGHLIYIYSIYNIILIHSYNTMYPIYLCLSFIVAYVILNLKMMHVRRKQLVG